MQLPTAPLNQYQHLHPLPPRTFFHRPHLNSPWQRHSRQLTTKQSGEEEGGKGGSQAVDQGREDGGATRRWQGNNIPFSSIDRDHNSCLSRDRLRKAIAQGAVKHGCLGELKVKRKTQFAEPLPPIQPTALLLATGIFLFLIILFFFYMAVERPKQRTVHIDYQTINLLGLLCSIFPIFGWSFLHLLKLVGECAHLSFSVTWGVGLNWSTVNCFLVGEVDEMKIVSIEINFLLWLHRH